MTDEQKIERRKWLDENFKDNMICNNKKSKEDGTYYVFISYKSDDWEKALKDIVYPLVKDYGLNVYFDREFEDRNDNWVTQFTDNMNDPFCKGVVAFYSKKYTNVHIKTLRIRIRMVYLLFLLIGMMAVNMKKIMMAKMIQGLEKHMLMEIQLLRRYTLRNILMN